MKEVGILLKQAREGKKLKVKDAAKELKIRQQYIEILESGDLSSLEGHVNVNLYLKSYAKWLGVDPSTVVYDITTEKPELAPQEPSSSGAGFTFPSFPIGINIFGSSKKPSEGFGRNEEIVRPNKLISLFALIAAIAVYAAWYKANNVLVTPTFEASSGKELLTAGNNFANILATKGTKFLLVAKEVALIRVKDESGNIIAKQLDIGEIYFLSIEKNSFLETDNPRAIEVVADDETSTSFGTLDTITAE